MMKWIPYCVLICSAQCLWASTNTFSNDTKLPQGFFVGAGAGATFPNIDSNNFLTTSTGWPQDRYHYTQAHSSAILSMLGGYTWATYHDWLPYYSLAINYTYAFPAKISGTIEQYSLPEFENYNFHYHLQRQTFLATFKLNLYRWQNISPFLSTGAGLSANRVSGYDEMALTDVTARDNPAYGTNTTINFSYTLGAGLDFITTKNSIVSLEYNYGYFGQAKTGSVLSDNVHNRLHTKLTASTITLTINYFLNQLA